MSSTSTSLTIVIYTNDNTTATTIPILGESEGEVKGEVKGEGKSEGEGEVKDEDRNKDDDTISKSILLGHF